MLHDHCSIWSATPKFLRLSRINVGWNISFATTRWGPKSPVIDAVSFDPSKWPKIKKGETPKSKKTPTLCFFGLASPQLICRWGRKFYHPVIPHRDTAIAKLAPLTSRTMAVFWFVPLGKKNERLKQPVTHDGSIWQVYLPIHLPTAKLLGKGWALWASYTSTPAPNLKGLFGCSHEFPKDLRHENWRFKCGQWDGLPAGRCDFPRYLFLYFFWQRERGV